MGHEAILIQGSWVVHLVFIQDVVSMFQGVMLLYIHFILCVFLNKWYFWFGFKNAFWGNLFFEFWVFAKFVY